MAAVKDTDKGFKKLRKLVKKQQVVTVGVQGAQASASHGDMTNVGLASSHEFGLGNNERRPFIRGYVDANKRKIGTLRRKLALAVIDGRINVRQAGDILGEFVQKGIKTFIAKGIPPEVQDATVDRRVSGRKSKNALIDTNQMRQAITHVVTIK